MAGKNTPMKVVDPVGTALDGVQDKEVSPGSKGASLYSVEDFTAGAREIFGISPDLVRAALRSNGIKECTKAEAERAVKAFAERKVK